MFRSRTPKENVSAEDLISDVKNGIMIHGRGSYSIDQQRYNFQFGGQTFWEIKNGKVVGMLKDVAYQSRTTDFWNACDALGGRSTYELPGTFNDGKGQPGQSNAVSHGCPVARFRNINVLNTAKLAQASACNRPKHVKARIIDYDSKSRFALSSKLAAALKSGENLMLLTEKETKEITDKILSFVKADDANVSVGSEKYSHSRFAANAFLTSGNTVERNANITVWIKGKRGASSTTDFDDASLKAMVEQAEKVAEISPVDKEYLPTLELQKYKSSNAFVDATAEISLENRAKKISDILKQSEKASVISAGFHEARATAGGFATKNKNFGFVKNSYASSFDDGANGGRHEFGIFSAQRD